VRQKLGEDGPGSEEDLEHRQGSLQGVDELELFRGFGNDGCDVDTLEMTRPRRSEILRRLRRGHPFQD
jgi:hypothetical protein